MHPTLPSTPASWIGWSNPRSYTRWPTPRPPGWPGSTWMPTRPPSSAPAPLRWLPSGRASRATTPPCGPPPRPDVPRAKQRTPELRERVLHVAVTTLADHGVTGFTTRKVAEEADTSIPAVYELFGARSGLDRKSVV